MPEANFTGGHDSRTLHTQQSTVTKFYIASCILKMSLIGELDHQSLVPKSAGSNEELSSRRSRLKNLELLVPSKVINCRSQDGRECIAFVCNH